MANKWCARPKNVFTLKSINWHNNCHNVFHFDHTRMIAGYVYIYISEKQISPPNKYTHNLVLIWEKT